MNTTTSKHRLVPKYLLLLVAFTATLRPPQTCASDLVPLKGNAEGAIVAASPDPGGLVVSVLAHGTATHLGEYSRAETLLLDPNAGTIAGSIVFTAANGDQIFGVVAGQFTSPTTVAGSYRFTGGTGRFVNADGEADFSLSTPDGVHFSVTFAGNLSSIGANKKK